jgi:hypothetical protein
MRYTTLLTSIEKATAKYEATIQRLLSRYAKADSVTSEKLLASLPQKPKKLHWTQRPENKARVAQQLKKALKAKTNG